jgi:RNA recognition motif-containing protein
MLPVKVRFAEAERERIGFAPVQLPDNPKLYVRCLNKQTTKMEVNEVFSRYGIIEDIYMALDDMKICRGYAFVQFSCKEMALAAIKALNGLFTIRVVEIVFCCIPMAQCIFGVHYSMTYCISVFLTGF